MSELLSHLSRLFNPRKNRPSPPMEDNTYLDMSPNDGTAGLILQNCYLPEEMLTNILSFLDPDSLLQCRKVCKCWRSLIDEEVWKWKIKSEENLSFNASAFINSLHTASSWMDMYWICKKHPFRKNLLKNNCGQSKFKHWTILSNGGNKWTIENPPMGADPLPTATTEELQPDFCFATSYHSCSKKQIIDLRNEGLTTAFMDKIQPFIYISEWHAGRFDCGCVYEIEVKLLKADKKELASDFVYRHTTEQWQGGQWHKVSHLFKNYGPGVRYIEFYHGGMDTQFWAGQYGSKMTGALVKIDAVPNS